MNSIERKKWLAEGKTVLSILVNIAAIGFGFTLYDGRPMCAGIAMVASVLAIIMARRMAPYDMD
jgi:hypothetical protein